MTIRKEHRNRATTFASRLRQRRMSMMRGRCSDMTVDEWAAELRCRPATVRDYANDLGERCKPAPKPEGHSTASSLIGSDFDWSLMQTWARRRIA